MHQAHGFVEFRQLGEWYGVVDAGALLVPNRSLSVVLVERATSLGQASLPEDASLAVQDRIGSVRGELAAEAVLYFRQLVDLRRTGEVEGHTALLSETLFLLLIDICALLARQFGETEVRLVLYFD